MEIIPTTKIKTGRYRHYKGDIVEVLGIALHSETLEEMMVYKHVESEWVQEILKYQNNQLFL